MSIDAEATEVAKRAASRLASYRDPALLEKVEERLAENPEPWEPTGGRPLAGTFILIADPISLATLIVGMASLAWTVYHDLKKDRQAPRTAKAMTARLTERLKYEIDRDLLPTDPDLADEQYAMILDVIAAEIAATTPGVVRPKASPE